MIGSRTGLRGERERENDGRRVRWSKVEVKKEGQREADWK